MITSGLHESTDEPPDTPVFHSGGVKKKKQHLKQLVE